MDDRRSTLLQASLLRLVRRGAWEGARRLIEKSHPADVARVLDRLTEADRKQAFDLIRGADARSEVVAHLEFGARAELLGELDPAGAARIVRAMPVDDAAETLRELTSEQSDEILAELGESGGEIESLLGYPASTAGAIMSPEFLALSDTSTVEEAIETLRKKRDVDPSFYVYVVDDRDHLVGVLSLRQLIVQSSQTLLRDCMMQEPIRVSDAADQEEVAKMVARYDLLALPIVDAGNKLLGVVTVDDVIDVMQEEATEDILKMAGTTVEETAFPGVLRGSWIRFPWLAASFVGGIGGLALLSWFQGLLEQTVALIFFLPLILAMGGNVGNQCAMVVVRGLATGRIDRDEVLRVISHELGTGLLLASVFGVTLAVFAAVAEFGTALFPLAVGLGIGGAMLIASLVGTSLPFLFRRIGVDPAVAAGPFVTTAVDVLGIGVLFLVVELLL